MKRNWRSKLDGVLRWKITIWRRQERGEDYEYFPSQLLHKPITTLIFTGMETNWINGSKRNGTLAYKRRSKFRRLESTESKRPSKRKVG